MSNNYPTKKLGEVCDFQNGLWTGKKPPFVTASVVRNTNFKNNDGTLNLGDVAEIEVEEKQLKNRLLEEGDLILERSGGGPTQPVGRVVYFDADGKFSFSNFTTRIRVRNSKELDSVYLWRCLNYLYLSGVTEKMQKQTTGIRNLNFSEYKELQIPLQPLAEQKKIVARLEGLLGKIKEAKQLRAEAGEAAQNLLPAELHRIFTQQHSNILQNVGMSDSRSKEKWEEKELGEVFVFHYGKGLPRPERSESGKYIVYGANGELGRSDRYLIDGEGIIVGRKGSAGEVTRATGRYWPTDVTYFITKDKKYDIGFAYYLFKFLNFPQYAVGVKPGINRKEIYGIKIPLPSVAEQKKIVARLDSLSEKIKNLREYQTQTRSDFIALEQSVLSKSFQHS